MNGCHQLGKLTAAILCNNCYIRTNFSIYCERYVLDCKAFQKIEHVFRSQDVLLRIEF